MKPELPTIIICGTDFLVDVKNQLLAEKSNLTNTISFKEMAELPGGYTFAYNPRLKNIPYRFFISPDDTMVEIPEMAILHPEGMAHLCGVTVAELKGKSDFDLLVDQEIFKARVEGQLPTVDVLGTTFICDYNSSSFITANEIDRAIITHAELEIYYHADTASYVFPYNPQKKSLEAIDFFYLTNYPIDLVPIELPAMHRIDPVGANRKTGLPDSANIKFKTLKLHFEAKKSNWAAMGLDTIITENKKRIQNTKPVNAAEKSIKRKGRKF